MHVQIGQKIIRNSVANYGGTFVGFAVGFLLTPFLVRSLGDVGYGTWILIGSISSYFWLLDFGLGNSVTKFVSEFRATGDQQRLNAVVASSFALLAVVGIVSLAGSLAVAQLAGAWFHLPEAMVPEVKTMIYITGVTLLVSFPLGVFGSLLRGYQRYDLVNLVVVVSTLSNAVLSFAVVKVGLGLVGLAIVGLLTNLVVGGGRLALAKRIDPGLVLGPAMVNRSVLCDITGFSVWVFVINFAVQVVYRTSPIVISSVLSVAQVTPFAIANSLVQYSRRFVDPVLAVLLPAYAELSAVRDVEHTRQLFTEGSKIIGAIAMPIALSLVLLGKPFINLWIGPGYEQSAILLDLLVPPLYLSFLVATGDKLLWAKGKVRVNSYVAIADTVLNLSLSIGLALTIGLIGVVLATLLSVLITNGLWLMPYMCRESGVSVRGYLELVVKPIVTPALPAVAAVLLEMRLIGVGGYPQLVLAGATCVGTYWLLFVALSGKKEREHWLSVLRSGVSVDRSAGLRGAA